MVAIRPTLWLAAVPSLLAAVAIGIAASEARRLGAPVRRRVSLELRGLKESGLARPLLPVMMFEIGNVSTTLLILRSTDLLEHGSRGLTAATSLAVLIYAAHNLFAAAVAFTGGHWIDRIGPAPVFGAGAVLYVAAYTIFATAGHLVPIVVIAFVLAGSGIGLAEAAESTLVARLLPPTLRGSGFGVLGALQALGGLASSAVVGLLWVAISPTVGFLYAAAWMALTAAVLVRRSVQG